MFLKSIHLIKYIGFYVFLCATYQITAQNLIKNPSFEQARQHSNRTGNFHLDVIDWTIPSEGSTDYFNDVSSDMKTSFNFIGRQSVYEGKAYAGFYMYGPDNYREYITSTIAAPLEKGKLYKISFMVSLADKSGLAVDQFEILFTDKTPSWESNKNINIENLECKENINYAKSRHPSFYSNKLKWIRVSAKFIANGTEKYMTIGNFKRNIFTKTQTTGKNLKKAAYYYFDMFSLTQDPYQFELDEIYVVEDLLFSTDVFAINRGAKSQLNALVKHLRRNPDLKIIIYGHTDNEGNRNYNKELSLKRAKTVGEFLLKNGLKLNRVLWRGFGDKAPLANNKTKKGRVENRRVEFVVFKGKENSYVNTTFED